MAAKKFFSWLIVGFVLLAVSAFVLVGTLINSKTTSSRKPEPMKECKPAVIQREYPQPAPCKVAKRRHLSKQTRYITAKINGEDAFLARIDADEDEIVVQAGYAGFDEIGIFITGKPNNEERQKCPYKSCRVSYNWHYKPNESHNLKNIFAECFTIHFIPLIFTTTGNNYPIFKQVNNIRKESTFCFINPE